MYNLYIFIYIHKPKKRAEKNELSGLVFVRKNSVISKTWIQSILFNIYTTDRAIETNKQKSHENPIFSLYFKAEYFCTWKDVHFSIGMFWS